MACRAKCAPRRRSARASPSQSPALDLIDARHIVESTIVVDVVELRHAILVAAMEAAGGQRRGVPNRYGEIHRVPDLQRTARIERVLDLHGAPGVKSG